MENIGLGDKHWYGLFFPVGVHDAVESFAEDAFECFLEGEVE